MSTARSHPRGRAWLRVLVLVLMLLVPGAHTEAHPAPVVSADTVDHDALDTALRPPSRAATRPLVPPRPAPLPDPTPDVPEGRPLPAPPRSEHSLHSLRSVVLRC